MLLTINAVPCDISMMTISVFTNMRAGYVNDDALGSLPRSVGKASRFLRHETRVVYTSERLKGCTCIPLDSGYRGHIGRFHYVVPHKDLLEPGRYIARIHIL